MAVLPFLRLAQLTQGPAAVIASGNTMPDEDERGDEVVVAAHATLPAAPRTAVSAPAGTSLARPSPAPRPPASAVVPRGSAHAGANGCGAVLRC